VVPLCHPAHPTVKPFSPAVVLRMPGILGNSPGIVGRYPYILRHDTDRTAITCAFCGTHSLSHSTVIVCLHPPRSFLFFRLCASIFCASAFTGLFLARSTHSLHCLTRCFQNLFSRNPLYPCVVPRPHARFPRPRLRSFGPRHIVNALPALLPRPHRDLRRSRSIRPQTPTPRLNLHALPN
jgi:hypothetical protein